MDAPRHRSPFLRFLIHFGAPCVFGVFVGWALEWSVLQSLTFILSLTLFTHWLSSFLDWGAYEFLNILWVGLFALLLFAVMLWFSFWSWEGRLVWYGRDIPIDKKPYNWIPHPRMVSIAMTVLPVSPFLKDWLVALFERHKRSRG